jgi:hypothetical protein
MDTEPIRTVTANDTEIFANQSLVSRVRFTGDVGLYRGPLPSIITANGTEIDPVIRLLH